MSTAKRVIKNTGFLYAKMGITIIISLYTTRLVLNALGASDFGIFNVVGGAIAMLGFLNTAMASATQRFMSYSKGEGDKDKQKKIFNISVVLHFFIALVLGMALLVAGYFFFNGVLNIEAARVGAAKVVYGSLIISTMFTVMTVPYDAVLNARENMLYYAIVGIIESVLKLGVALAVVYMVGDKLVIYGVLMAIIPLIVMTIMRVYCHRKYEECIIAPRKYWDKKLMSEMRGFAGWNLLGFSAGVLYGYGSNIVLNRFFGTTLNATNGVCGQLNGQLQSFSNNMLKAFNPVIVKAEGSGKRDDMYKLTFASCKLSVLMYSLFAIPFFIESSFVLKFWLKDVPAYTEIFLQLMILQVLIEQVSFPLATSISAVGKVKQYNIVNSLILYISIPVLYWLYKLNFPPQTLRVIQVGVAIFQTSYKIFFSAFYAKMPFRYFSKEVLVRCAVVVVSTFLAASIVSYILPQGVMRLLVVFSTSFIFFLVLFYAVALNKEERAKVQDIICSKKHKLALENLK